jgi:hypothetical protein
MLPSGRATEDHSYGSHIEYPPPMLLWRARSAPVVAVYTNTPSLPSNRHPHRPRDQYRQMLGWRESERER